MSARPITSALAACLLLGAAAAPSPVHADRARQHSCQASKGKGGRAGASGRAGRGANKSKAASQSTPSGSTASAPQADDSDDLSGLDEDTPKPAERAAPKQPATVASSPSEREAAVAEPSGADEATTEPDAETPETETGAEAAPPPENATQEGEGGPSLVIEPYAGIGITTRSVRMPSATGVLDVAPGVAPSGEVGLRVLAWPTADFSFFVNLVYQSALGFSVTEHPPLALEKQVRARSERVALEVAPRWRIASGKLELGVPLGATVRTLWAEVHTSQTPSYSLLGPHARVELRVVLSEFLALRLGPELQYIIMVDRDLITAGVASQGVAVGGDASLEAQLSQVWSLRIAYRESHALLGATRGNVTFQDVERYLTLRAVGSF